MKFISTSALAKEREIESKDLFKKLSDRNWIYRKDDQWHLTQEGKLAGGKINYNPNYGEYVVWPINLNLENEVNKADYLNATSIGQEFNISAQKVNSILAELGWISKSEIGGWTISKFGSKNGGNEMDAMNGSPYVVWNKSILTNNSFLDSVKTATGEIYNEERGNEIETSSDQSTKTFRNNNHTNIRTQDGHLVRSRAEAMIDDYLYRNGIVHAYERRLPGIEENLLCDFYILQGNVYIEYWGMEGEENYDKRKKEKLNIYAREGFNLIELNKDNIESLDDILPRKLRNYGIKVD